MSENYKPLLGDIVLYRVAASDDFETRHNHADTLPAVVVCVWSDTCVNLKILTDGPVDTWKTSAVRGNDEGEWEPKAIPLESTLEQTE